MHLTLLFLTAATYVLFFSFFGIFTFKMCFNFIPSERRLNLHGLLLMTGVSGSECVQLWKLSHSLGTMTSDFSNLAPKLIGKLLWGNQMPFFTVLWRHSHEKELRISSGQRGIRS